MVCHEVWLYDDRGSLAALTDFTLLCPNCSAVHHIGRQTQVGRTDEARAHMAAVNGITPAEVDAVVREAFAEWRRRSRRCWTVTVTPKLRARHPELALLDGALGKPGEGQARARQRGR